MKIAVIDDDLLTLKGAQAIFDCDAGFSRSVTSTLDEALREHSGHWEAFDRIFIDVHDKAKEVRERGTDVFDGVPLIASIRRSGFTRPIVAITPNKANPLLAERLKFSGVHYVYERWDFQSTDDLLQAVLNPCELARPKSHHPGVLLQEGLAMRANPNLAVEVLKASPLYGRVLPGITQAAIGPRRAVDRLKDQVVATGFIGAGAKPRWNEVRDYLLKLMGRLSVDCRCPPE